MGIRILRAAEHRRMAWKNGRGETVEIAIHPASAGLEDFDWRVSMAGVVEEGDFSIFPGIDRSLAVLSGEGVELSVAGAPAQRLTPQSAALRFAADLPTHARLVGGPITDLNVMTRRGVHVHRLVRDSAGAACDLRLILATAPMVLALPDGDQHLGALDALLCDGPDATRPLARATPAWLVEISRA